MKKQKTQIKFDLSNLLTEETIVQHNSETEGRHYSTPNGGYYPSVTSIVGILNEKHIKEWIKRVGEAEANKIKTEASEHGTRWHDLMEKSLREGVQTIPFGREFFAVYPMIVNDVYPKISNIRAIEHRMWSDKVSCAGTVDLIADYDGVLSIIDWKTASHEKKPSDVMSYWCQTAAYAIMLKERYGLDAKQLVLVINEADQTYSVYTQPTDYWIRQFERLRAFYRSKRHE